MKSAGTAEILRASQKDEEYMQYLRNSITDITQKCFGIPFWIRWKDFSETCSDALFYSLTTLSGLQTLGEEYANIIQINRSSKVVPTKWARICDVSLHTFGSYLLLKSQAWLENQLSSLPPTSESESGDWSIHNLKAHLPAIFKTFSVIQRLNLIAFYLYGNYYTLAKRLSGTKYVVIRRWLSQPSQQNLFKILGWLAAIQLCLSLAISVYSSSSKNSSSSTKDRVETSSDEVNSQNQCSLCFEKRRHSTATPCGHLFCWDCITSWMQTKQECPLCRESFPPSKLIFLQNYY